MFIHHYSFVDYVNKTLYILLLLYKGIFSLGSKCDRILGMKNRGKGCFKNQRSVQMFYLFPSLLLLLLVLFHFFTIFSSFFDTLRCCGRERKEILQKRRNEGREREREGGREEKRQKQSSTLHPAWTRPRKQ